MLLASGLSWRLFAHPHGRVWLQGGASGGAGLQPSQFTCTEASPWCWFEVGGSSCPLLPSSWAWLALVRGR